MERRIVTDGKIFRIQFNVREDWVFYHGIFSYPSKDEAQAILDRWALQDQKDAPDGWMIA